jgi:hypothetical protein
LAGVFVAQQRHFGFRKLPSDRPYCGQRNDRITKLADAENEKFHELSGFSRKLRPWLIAVNLAKPLSIPASRRIFLNNTKFSGPKLRPVKQ